tara:strand:+ start:31611 stop:32324 length:714 start_codon:yes stop_codon:yes gene_type:complete
MEVSNKTIMVLLIATIVVSLGGTYISLSAVNNRLASIGLAPITGFVTTVPNATATVTVNTVSSIQFSQSSVAFGSGSVNTTGGFNNCTLSTTDAKNTGCTDFNEVYNGFTIENDGNTNLSVELRSNVSAIEFVGVNNALFLWNVTVNETGSCVNKSGTSRTSVEPNTTSSDTCGGMGPNDCGSIFESVSTSNKNICPSLLFGDGNDALNVDINISIPYDAPTGAKLAGLIVTGTAEP